MYKFFREYSWCMWLGICMSFWDVTMSWGTVGMMIGLILLVDWHSGGIDELIKKLKE